MDRNILSPPSRCFCIIDFMICYTDIQYFSVPIWVRAIILVIHLHMYRTVLTLSSMYWFDLYLCLIDFMKRFTDLMIFLNPYMDRNDLTLSCMDLTCIFYSTPLIIFFSAHIWTAVTILGAHIHLEKAFQHRHCCENQTSVSHALVLSYKSCFVRNTTSGL